MTFRIVLMVGALALCAACGPKAAAPEAMTDASCPDESARLPGTGLCQRTAADLIQRAAGAREVTYGEGCSTVINETMMIGDEAILYGAARCGETTTKLAFAAGAHSASITYETSAGGGAPVGTEVVRVFGADPDPQGALKEQIAALPAAEKATCEIRPADIDGWPADALVIAPNAAARAKMPKNEPIAACGPMGLDEDSQTYWRVFQGQAWFFQLGQDDTDFDPASITVVTKGADGNWIAKP